MSMGITCLYCTEIRFLKGWDGRGAWDESSFISMTRGLVFVWFLL